MPDITENTRVAIKTGSIISCVVFLIWAGHYWGTWDKERLDTQATLVKHDERIEKLEGRFDGFEKMLIQIQADQSSAKDSAKQTAANTTALMFDWGNLKTALASHGIVVKGD